MPAEPRRVGSRLGRVDAFPASTRLVHARDAWARRTTPGRWSGEGQKALDCPETDSRAPTAALDTPNAASRRARPADGPQSTAPATRAWSLAADVRGVYDPRTCRPPAPPGDAPSGPRQPLAKSWWAPRRSVSSLSHLLGRCSKTASASGKLGQVESEGSRIHLATTFPVRLSPYLFPNTPHARCPNLVRPPGG